MTPPSIRRALSGPVVVGSVLAVALAGLASVLAVEQLMRREFDRALLAKARLLATLTEHVAGKVDIAFADEYLPEFSTAHPREYFELRTSDGQLVERSRSLAHKRLPRGHDNAVSPRFSNLVLPDGRPGRAVEISFLVHPREDDADLEPPLSSGTGPRALLVVARGTQGIDGVVRALYGIHIGAAAAIAVAIALLVRHAVGRSLAPLDDLALQVETLGSDRLAARVAIQPAVAELTPIVVRLNGLLARLEQAFVRERQFSANVAHELRTPVAELKSLAEVGARWPDSPGVAGAFFADALAIAQRMERTTEQLLALARTEAGLESSAPETVALGALVATCWTPLAALASARRVTFDRPIDSSLALFTDRAKLELIVSHLLSNAVEHSPEGSHIEFAAQPTAAGACRLEVSNLAPHLTAADMPSLFLRFWRKDAARASAEHSGLGLALVNGLAGLLDFLVTAELSTAGRLTIRLEGGAVVEPSPAE